MKYLPLFHHFKAIHQFPKHIIFLDNIVANASLNKVVLKMLHSCSNVLFFTILYGRNKWGQVWIYLRQLDNLTKHWKIIIYQKELCFYYCSLHSYLLICLCHYYLCICICFISALFFTINVNSSIWWSIPKPLFVKC